MPEAVTVPPLPTEPPAVVTGAFAPSTLRGWTIFQRAVNETLPDALAKSAQARNRTLATLKRLG